MARDVQTDINVALLIATYGAYNLMIKKGVITPEDALEQIQADAGMLLSTDAQKPAHTIIDLLRRWIEKGHSVSAQRQ